MNTFKNSIKKNISFAVFIFILMSLNFYMNWRIIKPSLKYDAQTSKVNINKDLIDILSMGNRRLFSSIYWIETLMDSDLAHYKKQDLNNWMFHRFDTITSLNPQFYEAYLFGGIYLSIVKDDENGAKIIYEKGLKEFPDDIELLYNGAFNDYFELNNNSDAIKKFEHLGKQPGGFKRYPFAISLSQRIKAKEGFSLNEIYNMLLDNYNKTEKTPFLQKFFTKTLYGLKAEIDLDCLNKKLEKCEMKDFDGRPYFLDQKSGLYKARRKWKKFKLHKKVQN